jgi:pimeloyl-ACP methyl ester carboxylesterase
MPTVTANNIEIHYDTFGPKTGAPLLLIGGLGWQLIAWEEAFCQQLATKGFFVIRFDNRDTGLSTWFSDCGSPDLQSIALDVQNKRKPAVAYKIDDMAADSIGLMDALGIERSHICGTSLGGMVAQSMAINHPDRILSLTSIMSTTGNTELPRPDAEALAIASAERINDREAAAKRALDLIRVAGSPGFPSDKEHIIEKAYQAYDRAFNAEGVTRQIAAVFASGDRRPNLRKLSVNALIIHGTDDPLVPLTDGIDTHENIPGSELLVIDGMGHDLPQGVWSQIIAGISRHIQ